MGPFSSISAVNWPKGLQKSIRAGIDFEGMAQDWADIGVRFWPVTTQQAETARSVLTADHAWTALGLDVEIQVER